MAVKGFFNPANTYSPLAGSAFIAFWVAPLESRAEVSRTVPLRVSNSEPTGIRRAWAIGTNRTPFNPGTDCATRAEP